MDIHDIDVEYSGVKVLTAANGTLNGSKISIDKGHVKWGKVSEPTLATWITTGHAPMLDVEYTEMIENQRPRAGTGSTQSAKVHKTKMKLVKRSGPVELST